MNDSWENRKCGWGVKEAVRKLLTTESISFTLAAEILGLDHEQLRALMMREEWEAREDPRIAALEKALKDIDSVCVEWQRIANAALAGAVVRLEDDSDEGLKQARQEMRKLLSQ